MLKPFRRFFAIWCAAAVLVSVLAFGLEAMSCPPDSHWVRQHHRRAYIRADGKLFSATTVSAHCSKNPAGYETWRERFKVGRPLNWPPKDEKASPWTDEEKERVLEALSYLPPELRDVAIKALIRLHRSVNFPNPASGDSEGNIVLYDTAFGSGANLSQILAHELAHRVYRTLTPAQSEDYRTATLWWNQSGNATNPKWTCLRRGFVAPDGMDSPEEDFSNNVEYYLFGLPKLEAATPQAAQWIKSHFGGNFRLGKGGHK